MSAPKVQVELSPDPAATAGWLAGVLGGACARDPAELETAIESQWSMADDASRAGLDEAVVSSLRELGGLLRQVRLLGRSVGADPEFVERPLPATTALVVHPESLRSAAAEFLAAVSGTEDAGPHEQATAGEPAPPSALGRLFRRRRSSPAAATTPTGAGTEPEEPAAPTGEPPAAPASARWVRLAGPAVDVRHVELTLWCRDPQATLGGLLAEISPAARAANHVYIRTYERWRSAWDEAGFASAPTPDEAEAAFQRLDSSQGGAGPVVLVDPGRWLPPVAFADMLSRLPADAEVVVVRRSPGP